MCDKTLLACCVNTSNLYSYFVLIKQRKQELKHALDVKELYEKVSQLEDNPLNFS